MSKTATSPFFSLDVKNGINPPLDSVSLARGAPNPIDYDGRQYQARGTIEIGTYAFAHAVQDDLVESDECPRENEEHVARVDLVRFALGCN
jgi:hypothetical protein